MHPVPNFVTQEEHDSIAKAHMRLDALFQRGIEQALSGTVVKAPGTRAWKGAAARHGRCGAGKRLRRDTTAVIPHTIGALHHRWLWLETYLNDGALDELISNRVRDEARHFWNAVDEATLKLKALVEMGERVDAKLRAIDAAIEAFDVLQRVVNDAVPPQYKVAVLSLNRRIKRALAA